MNNGSLLVHGRITLAWQHILFWRSWIAVILHSLALLGTCSLSLKLGWFEQRHIVSKIEDILERPQDDTATMFAFVKQNFYQKSLAYTNYEMTKRKNLNKQKFI